jgi:tetratricopeptide (TPR) repeat protein
MERFLVEFDRTVGVYEVHPLIRSFAYSKLQPSTRNSFHAAAARYYVTKLPEVGADIASLASAAAAAYHYSRAGDLKHTLTIGTRFTESLLFLGVVLFKRHSFSNAAMCFDAMLQVDPGDERAHFYFAASLDLAGADSRSLHARVIEQHYRCALDKRPTNAQYLDYFAYFLSNMDRDAEAAPIFQKGIALGARCPTLYQRYAQLLERSEDFTTADRIYSLGCGKAYNSGQLFEDYAAFALRHQDRSSVTKILKWGLRCNPGSKGLLGLAEQYFSPDDWPTQNAIERQKRV